MVVSGKPKEERNMMNRRHFALSTASALGVLAVSPAASFALCKRPDSAFTEPGDSAAPEQLASDEKFWAQVRSAYTLNSDVINLDHGWTNPARRDAVDELVRGARQLEALPAEELERLFFGDSSAEVRTALADAMGVPPT